MSKEELCSQHDIRKLRNKLKDQELELKRMQDKINSLKEQTAQNTSNSGIEVTVNLSKKTDRTVRIVESPIPDLVSDDELLVSDDEHVVSDDEYFDRMLDEVQGHDVNAEVQEQDQEQMNIDRMEINYDVPVEQRDHQEQVPVSPLQLVPVPVEQREHQAQVPVPLVQLVPVPAEQKEHQEQVPVPLAQLVPVPAEQREHQERAPAPQVRQVQRPTNHQAPSGYRPRIQVQRHEQHRQDDNHLAWIYADRGDHLQAQAQALREILHEFPYRTIKDSDTVDETVQCAFCKAEARHYSDSCPVVISGDERFAIVMNDGICRFCLGNCPAEQCRFRTRRPCWYCKKIEGTIVEDLIPDDRGHHKAICPVPDKRAVVRERLTQVQREIDRMWPR